MAKNDSSDSPRATTLDVEKLRVSERQIDSSLKELGSTLSTHKDKDGQERIWGFKVSKTAAFAINSLYDNIILPFTGSGAKQIYQGVLKLAEKSEHTSGRAHEIASAVALAARIGIVVAKPVVEFVGINRQHYAERSELSTEVTNAIAGTPANYQTNEVIASAFERVNNQWSRDVTRKIPDMIKTGIQASIAYGDHQSDMSKKPGAYKTGESSTPSSPTVDHERIALDARVNSMKAKHDAPELIALEIEEYKRRKGMGLPADSSDKQLGVLTPNLSGVLGAGTEFVKIAVDEYTESSVSKGDNAWDKIQFLKKFMDEQPAGQNPDRIRVNGTSLKKFIVDIFQQNEVDRGRGRMGEALVEQLMPAVDKIAHQLADTTMDTNALVHLVGDHQIIIHQGTARVFASEEKVDAAITAVRGVNTSKEKINTDEFFSNFADPMLAKGMLKKNIETLQGKEKALFAAIFPDDLLIQAGMTKDGIATERKEAHAFIYDVVAANTIELAKDSPDELKALGLNKAEIAAVKALGVQIEHGDLEGVKVAADGADATVRSALRTAALHKQIEEGVEAGQKVWTEMVSKGATIREKLENGDLQSKSKPKSFADAEKKGHSHSERHHKDDDTVSMTASEREAHRRKNHDNEHDGASIA